MYLTSVAPKIMKIKKTIAIEFINIVDPDEALSYEPPNLDLLSLSYII